MIARSQLWCPLLLLLLAGACRAESTDVIATITSLTGKGKVEVTRKADSKGVAAAIGIALKAGDQLKLSPGVSVVVLYSNDVQKTLKGPSEGAVALPREKPKLAENLSSPWRTLSAMFQRLLGRDAGWDAAGTGATRGGAWHVKPLTPLRPRSRVDWEAGKPVPERVPPGELVFEWTAPRGDGGGSYEITLQAKGGASKSLKPRKCETVEDPLGFRIVRARVPAGTVKPQQEYRWRVALGSGGSQSRSQWASFTVLSDAEWKTLSAAAQSLRDVPVSTGAFYHEKGCVSLAKEQYHLALTREATAGPVYLLLSDLYQDLELSAFARKAESKAKQGQAEPQPGADQ